MDQVVDDFVVELEVTSGESILGVIEQRIRLVTQPQPRWLPASVWQWLLRRTLMIVEVD